MKYYVADLESTTNPVDCRVWSYTIFDVSTIGKAGGGETINDFMNWCMKQKDNPIVYFHNAKFDLQFVISWLLNNGYRHITDKTEKATKTFSTIISSLGMYYQCEIIFKKTGKKVHKITIWDSYKLIPLSVKQIAKTYKLPFSKGSIDYTAHDNLPEGSPRTPEEIEYNDIDAKIVAYAVKTFIDNGLTRMTISSCALEEYKNLIGKKNFERFFPEPLYHEDVKRTYKGGWTWLNPEFQNVLIEDIGIVLDVNSLYADVMYDSLLPYGKAIYFEGKYEPDEFYPLYTQKFRCQFELKEGKVPTVQLKDGPLNTSIEYLTSSNDEEVVLCMTNVDLELFLENYYTYNMEYISGYKFHGSRSFFKEYIDKWIAIKQKATEEKNYGLRLIAKLFLVSLYGKFGTDNKAKSKIPYMDEATGRVRYKQTEEQSKNAVYIAMASFITAYARRKTISAAQKIMDRHNEGLKHGLKLAQFIYSDTDSLHILLGDETVESFLEQCGLTIHDKDLGAWDHEATFTKAKFIRSKCYMEQQLLDEEEYYEELEESDQEYLFFMDNGNYYYNKITVAGMPSDCYEHVTLDNFKPGATYQGKKQPVIVAGGVVLQDVDFTIKI